MDFSSRSFEANSAQAGSSSSSVQAAQSDENNVKVREGGSSITVGSSQCDGSYMLSCVCIVCEGQQPKYKCTVCRASFCSAACSKAHKGSDVCLSLKKKSIEESAALTTQQKDDDNENGNDNDANSSNNTIATTAGQKRQRENDGKQTEPSSFRVDTTTSNPQILEKDKSNANSSGGSNSNTDNNDNTSRRYMAGDAIYDDEGNIQVLGHRQLDAIRSDRRLRDVLRTRELRSMIKIVDKSRSRIDALEAAIHNSSDFEAFCDTLLGVVYRNS